jgi:hypothetical protein
MALGFEHNQMVEKLRVAVEALNKIISCDKRLPDFSDDRRTIIAYEALAKIKGGSDE